MSAPAEDEGLELAFEPPGCAQLADGDVFIPDVDAFVEMTGALAIQVRDGNLFVLDESFGWVNVEALRKPKPSATATVRAIKGKSE